MLFNSIRYVVFFPCVVFVYFLCPQRFRWVLLLGASYYFYMCWKAEYLALILLSTVIDYFAGLMIGRSKTRGTRFAFLLISLTTNLGLLFTFKYFNFVNDSLRALLQHFNVFYDVPAFHLLLPVGISFYTFQAISYTIDVYRGDREPERHPGIFAVYVAYFPQLVAGPIERSTSLMPQFYERHAPDRQAIFDGLRLMAWGFFKKIVIADRLAPYVTEVFNHPSAYHGGPVWLAAYLFSFQIYCDFSGYTDIAIGSARIMGFHLMDNFQRPYFAENIADFWRRWHISLSGWFRDYLYTPLGGSYVRPARWRFNIMATFVASGLWHGANWTFLIWGALHGFYYVASQWTTGLRRDVSNAIRLDRTKRLRACVRALITFHLVTFAYIFFRAGSLGDAGAIIRNLFRHGATGLRVFLTPTDFTVGILGVIFLLAVEWFWHKQDPANGRSPLADRSAWARRAFYYGVCMSILVFGKSGANPFIYFQF